jgi:hypothetical protein
MPVDDAQSLETTLARIRQRYALHFHLPNGAKPGQERNIELELTAAARRRYPDADVRYRQAYVTPDGAYGNSSEEPQTVEVTSAPVRRPEAAQEPEAKGEPEGPPLRRRPAVDDSYGSRLPSSTSTGAGGSSNSSGGSAEKQSTGGWRRVGAEQSTPVDPEPEAPQPAKAKSSDTKRSKPETKAEEPEEPPQRGWRRVKPGEQP